MKSPATNKHELLKSFFKKELTLQQEDELTDWIKEAKSDPEQLNEIIDIWVKHYSSAPADPAKYDHQKAFARFRERCLGRA